VCGGGACAFGRAVRATFDVGDDAVGRPRLQNVPSASCSTAMSLFARIASWLANEVVTKKLAQNEGFQRFAQTVHRNVTKAEAQVKIIKKDGIPSAKETLNKVAEQRKKVVEEAGSTVGNSGFFSKIKNQYAQLEKEGKALEAAEKASKRAKDNV